MRKVGGNAVRYVVKLAQDNALLYQMINEMTNYIADNGLWEISAQKKNVRFMIKQYFKKIALDKLTKDGFKMGIETPWGKDAAEHGVMDVDYDYMLDSEEDEN
ncbi:MAG: hypothetical protein J6T10_24415 [Methanobrevibacter sp.]|jgi:hypothetical protein|nr:hypothetical protein [Methanobrevibacter sp.]